VGEANVFSKEDPPPPAWSGDKPSVEVDWSGMFGSPLSSPSQVAEVSTTRRSEPVAREKGAGSSSQPGARPAREDQRDTRSQAAPSGSHASDGRRDLPCRDDPPKRPAE
jgi:hypothetical protein